MLEWAAKNTGCLVGCIWGLILGPLILYYVVGPDILLACSVVAIPFILMVFLDYKQRAQAAEIPQSDLGPGTETVEEPSGKPMDPAALRRRFRRELREGIIDQDEYDSLVDIYDLKR